MKVSYCRVVAVTILVAGTLVGCSGGKLKELEAQMEAVSKERDDAKAEYTSVQGLATGCEDSKRVFKFTADAELDQLKKENAALKTQLAQKK